MLIQLLFARDLFNKGINDDENGELGIQSTKTKQTNEPDLSVKYFDF